MDCGCFSLIFKWLEGTGRVCGPRVPPLPFCTLRLRAHRTLVTLVTSSYPTALSDSFQKLLHLGMDSVMEATAAGPRGRRPACYGEQWCQRRRFRHCWFCDNDDATSVFQVRPCWLVPGEDAHHTEQPGVEGKHRTLHGQAPLTWPHHRSGSRYHPAGPPRSPPPAQSWSEMSANRATSRTPVNPQAGSPPK